MARPVLVRVLFSECRSGTGTDKSIDKFPDIATDPSCSNAAIHGSTDRDHKDEYGCLRRVVRNGNCGRMRLPGSRVPSLSSLTRCIRHRDDSMVRPVLVRALFRVRVRHWRYRRVYRQIPQYRHRPLFQPHPWEHQAHRH
jgi:hypothetical protein